MSGGEEEEIARLNYIIDEMCKGYTRCADCPLTAKLLRDKFERNGNKW